MTMNTNEMAYFEFLQSMRDPILDVVKEMWLLPITISSSYRVSW